MKSEKRDFNKWISTFMNNLTPISEFSDFRKSFENVNKFKEEILILNKLIGDKDIENSFRKLISYNPKILKVIPFLLATRMNQIQSYENSENIVYDFDSLTNSIDEYVRFMKISGLFDLIQNKLFNSIFDYLLGVEVGLDSNARKNRNGKIAEDFVESYLNSIDLIENVDYFKQMTTSEI